MAFPIAAALGLGSSLVGGFMGMKADKKAQKLAKDQLAMEQRLANRQIDISRYIEQYAKQAAGMSGNTTDIYGSRTWLNPATGEYEIKMGEVPRAIQDASDAEEKSRFTVDQALRRRGLSDFEDMRRRSVGDATAARERIQNFDRGIGKVDAGQLGSQIRADRTRAVNAGYDDAERAATKLQLRTGSSAVGDALANLARDRVRTQAQIGSPEVEGMQLAESMNEGRTAENFGRYTTFGNEGRSFYDAAFQPSNREAELFARLGDQMKFDLSKLDLAMGGQGTAASTIGAAGAGLRAGYGATAGKIATSPWANFIQGIGANAGNIEGIIKAFGGK